MRAPDKEYALGALVDVKIRGRVVASTEGADKQYVVQRGEQLVPCFGTDITSTTVGDGGGI